MPNGKPPFRADHVGKNLPSARSERVMVRLEESDGYDVVRIAPSPGERLLHPGGEA